MASQLYWRTVEMMMLCHSYIKDTDKHVQEIIVTATFFVVALKVRALLFVCLFTFMANASTTLSWKIIAKASVSAHKEKESFTLYNLMQ